MTDLQSAPTEYIHAKNNVTFAYRRLGRDEGVPLVMHIHFRANMDFWDPLLINTIIKTRSVILFDQAGVGRSTGTVPVTFQGWADDLIALLDALRLQKIDLFGFSLGGLAVQMVALTRPAMVRKLILAGTTAPNPFRQVPGTIWPRETAPLEPFRLLHTANSVDEGSEAIYRSFFPLTNSGRRAFNAYWSRVSERHIESPNLLLLDKNHGGKNQTAAAAAKDNSMSESWFDRLNALRMPVLIANGDDDVLIPTSRSWELLTQIENAQLIIYPQAGHGFLWQHALRFAEDIVTFLDGCGEVGSQPKL